MPSNPTPPRAPRCLRLVERTNGLKLKATEQCPNERLPGSDECAHHLGQAAADYREILATVQRAAAA